MVYSDQENDSYFFDFSNGRLRAFRIGTSPGTIDEPPQPCSTELDNLMDFIGFLDKNNKSIYEGDIYRFNFPLTNKSGARVYVVEWVEETAEYSIHNKSMNQYIKIIGNIHENKELLNGHP